MQIVKAITAVFFHTILLSSVAHAGGAEVVSMKQVDNQSVSVTFNTPFHCNQPEISLDFLYMNKAVFGPYHYELEAVGMNRMYCGAPAQMTVTLAIPENLKSGDVLVVRGENATSASISIKRDE